MSIDLNCDLGEGEPLRRTRELMRWITSANIACGGHAGNVDSMAACVRLAKEHRVLIGAHPGATAGRSKVELTTDELELLLLQQVAALERIAQREGARLHHIKLHGSLYHLTEADPALAKGYLAAVARWWPRLIVYARAGGRVSKLGGKLAVRVWDEVFADRNYLSDGPLVPRTEANALINNPAEAVAHARRLIATHEPQTVCVHSDTPNAVRILRGLGLREPFRKRPLRKP